ncbi:single-stranded DNA-binding protein, partial [Enterococcus faecalis]
ERLDKDGNAQTTFIQCVIWGKPAEVLAKYTQKGSLIAVNGELQSRSYDDQQGQTHYVTELVVSGFEFLESKETVQNREQKQQMPEMANAEPFYGMDDMEPPVYQ